MAAEPDKTKKQKKTAVAVTSEDGGASVTTKAKKPTKAPTKTKVATEPKKVVDKNAKKVAPAPSHIELPEDDSEIDDAEADQSAALLKGFMSSDDEDDEEGDSPADPAPIPDSELPSIPSNASKALTKRSAKKEDDDAAVVLYIGRIPHGFFERQMRAYFAQFGEISHLRLSRNRRTGASKHYAFVEFASGQVGRIVAETMNNYLLFGHILKVRIVPTEEVKRMGPSLWVGEGRRFKVIPWGGLERGQLKSADRDAWDGRVKKEEAKRAAKAKKLKELGYEFVAPALRQVETVPKRAPEPALVEQETVKQIEAPPANENELQEIIAAQKTKKTPVAVMATSKKTKKSKDGVEVEAVAQAASRNGVTTKKTKKVKAAV